MDQLRRAFGEWRYEPIKERGPFGSTLGKKHAHNHERDGCSKGYIDKNCVHNMVYFGLIFCF